MVAERSAAPPIVRRKTKRNFRPVIIAAAVAVVAGLGWFGWTKSHPADDGSTKLLTDTVKRGDLVESISATGSVTAQTGAQVKIGSQITGRIKRLYADVGSKVKAGDTIAELDLPDIEAQVHQAEASLVSAQANYAAAQTRLQQQLTGVGMQKNQTSTAVASAMASLNSAKARLVSAEAAANLQTAQTPNDIKRAQSAVNVAKAALATANSNYTQVQASANLQVATAQEELKQAQATSANATANLKRQQTLLDKGFVAASVVDAAQAAATVAQSQVSSASQNVDLVKAKVAADLQSARDNVTQAQQNVDAANAALVSAQAGTYSDASKKADVDNARAQVRQADEALRLAQGNTTQDVLKQQDIQAARDAVDQAAAAVKQARAQVDYNRAQMDKTIIKSPITGTVLQLASQQGETLAAGLSAPTLIIVADLNRLQVDAFVDETDIGKVHLNQDADITVDAFPKRVFKGHVTKVASGSTIQQGVITYDVTIALDGIKRQSAGSGGGPGGGGRRRGGNRGGAPGGPGAAPANGGAPAPGEPPVDNSIMGRLKPDMTASVTIQTGKLEGVLLVPSEAVKVSKRGTTVNLLVVKDGKKTAQPVPVKTGGSDGTFTEIREGLKEGDTIVVAGTDDGRRGFGPTSPFGPAGGNRGGGKGGGKGG